MVPKFLGLTGQSCFFCRKNPLKTGYFAYKSLNIPGFIRRNRRIYLILLVMTGAPSLDFILKLNLNHLISNQF